jgi:hypothetical protein
VSYVLAASRFWWTKNDRFVERFTWNGKTNRWEPIKGSPPRSLGVLTEDTPYTLFPRPTRFSIGDALPGNPSNSDEYTLVRVGIRPDSTSLVPNIEVVSDEDVETTYTFSGLTPNAVVGVTNGILQFNPAYIAANAGQEVWYTPEQFDKESDGGIGPLKGSAMDPLYLCPIPGPTDRPFVRLGFRRYLVPLAADSDSALAVLTVAEGEVGWSRTTGKLKISAADADKADPDAAGFNIQYLGNRVFYDGVSLTARSLRTRKPAQLVDDTGNPTFVGSANKLYIPRAEPLETGAGTLGLGKSGINYTPDETGTVPNITYVPSTRPNGCGLIRQIERIGDTILFGVPAAIEELEVVEFTKDLPFFPFSIRKGRAVVARELENNNSRVALGQKDRNRFSGLPLYFLQADVQPAVYAAEIRLYSREQGPFTLEGAERLYFAVDGTQYLWTAPAGTFTATVVAASINAVITGTGQAFALRDRIVIEGNTSVEIGFGPTGAILDRDFSGAAVLGFLPGWRVEDPTNTECWLPDHGATLGVFRSPQNRDRSKTTPDTCARAHFESKVFAEGLLANPVFPISNPPLQDVAGYDENVFFTVVDGLNFRPLHNLEDILYDFGKGRFFWLDQDRINSRVEQASNSLSLEHSGVVGDTLHPAVKTGNGLYVAEDGNTFALQTQGVDYLLPADGLQGQALLVNAVGAEITEGAAGRFGVGTTTFQDANATFLADGVSAGYRLRILAGDAAGSYIVSSVASETSLDVEADVPFPASAGPFYGEPYASWRLFRGYPTTVYDPAVVADVQYTQFNHLSTEPFQIRLLAALGPTPADPVQQAANRLVAVVTEAYQEGRTTSIRFGLPYGNAEAVLTPLDRGVELGVMANGSLVVPDLTDPHFLADDFSIRVGDKTYTIGTNLTKVLVFSSPLPGDQIEYGDPSSAIAGQLKFGEDTLADLEGSVVLYDQEYLDPTVLVAGTGEYSPVDGGINLSAADMTVHAGETTYFVEKMITEDRLDVVVSPIVGSFYVNRPLRAGQLVEAQYFPADTQGQKAGSEIVEFLPIIVRQETATRINARTYTVNPTGRTIATSVEAWIWKDSVLQNYGTVNADFQNGIITFYSDVDVASVVQVNYGVYEAFGGEQACNTSSIPVWRPPFFLLANQDTFVLDGDRTDLVPGMLLRLGAIPSYLKSVAYDGGTDQTTVVVWPPSDKEAGSRAPGNDVLTLLSSVPVALDVDGTPTSGSPGFLPVVATTYEPLDKGMLSVHFHGDTTQFMVAGHLLEIGGYPFIIVGSSLAEDGRTTKVDISSPCPIGLDSGIDAVRLSVRPIYPPNPSSFLGVVPFLESQPYEMVLFGETDRNGNRLPGRTLTRDVHYQVDPSSGAVELLSPVQTPLEPDQKLLFSYTQLRTLAPFIRDGAIIYPRYRAKFSYIAPPSEESGTLGTTLIARYTYQNPDSFYYGVPTLTDYMSDVAQIAIQRVQYQNPSGGPTTAFFGVPENKSQGRLGLKGERRDLTDQDRAARTFIDTYNTAIVAFEQALETFNGEVIGDRDGKFRFYIGKHKTYPPPGYEDDVTGDLNPRSLWFEVFLAENGSFGATEQDFVVNPDTAYQNPVTLEVTGDPMDPFQLRFYIQHQYPAIGNDMDDRVLVGRRKSVLKLTLPFPELQIRGDFKWMWEPHRLSRLFPEAGMAFTTLYPGLKADLPAGDPGVYGYRRMIEAPKLFKKPEGPIWGSTFNQPIGAIENPARGVLENLTSASARERMPRARIWAYYPSGSADLDAALGLLKPTAGKATIVATPLYLKDFPIDPTTGFPDIARFISQGGDLADLESGDQELSTPPFLGVDPAAEILQQVNFGQPTGEAYAVGNAKVVLTKACGEDISGMYGGVYVGSVEAGCVLILADENGSPLTGEDVLRLEEGDLEGSPITLVQGDTIFVGSAVAQDASQMSDPPTTKEMRKFGKSLPNYRTGFDIGVQQTGGNFFDLTFPSIKDPLFPMKEVTNQHPPLPLSTIEADVEYVNNDRTPFEFPALRGAPTNDDGDFSIPYLGTRNTELDRLGGVAIALEGVVQLDGPAPGIPPFQAVYPDEIVADDGRVLISATPTEPPATLLTARDLTPVTTAGSYTPNSGIGDVRPYDLVLMEKPSASGLPTGSLGVLSVGAVATNQIEPPRFVTETKRGTLIKYTFMRVMSEFTTTGFSGVIVTTVPFGPNFLTTFDISSVSGLVFNDGTGPGANGGLNNIIAGPGNALVIRLYQNPGGGGAWVEDIALNAVTCVGGIGAAAVVGPLIANEKTITVITAAPFVVNIGVVFDFTLDVDTYINNLTAALLGVPMGSGSGSLTARVEDDRLTFSDRYDMRTAAWRGQLTAGATSVPGLLAVWEITASGVNGVRVNASAEVNGGSDFSFLPRTPGTTVGGFSFATFPGAGDELGSVKAMGFEGFSNFSLAGTSITFSGVPSSPVNASGDVCSGVGNWTDGSCWLEVPAASVTLGAVGNIQSGDILTVSVSSIGDATTKAGTYLVRHAVAESGVTPGVREAVLNGRAGPAGAWAEVIFPKVTSSGALTITVSDTSGPGPGGKAWAATGRLYLVPDTLDPTTVVSMLYASLVGDTFTLTTGSGLDATGAGIADSAFFAVAAPNMQVTGMRYLPVGTTYPTPLPKNNVVGFGNGASTAGGFRSVAFSNTSLTGDVTLGPPYNVIFGYGANLVDSSGGGAPGVGNLGVGVATPVSPLMFQPDPEDPVYSGVAVYLDLSGITGAQWQQIHGDAAIHGTGTTGVVAVLPQDKLVTTDAVDADGDDNGGNPGFQAIAGIFIEPTFPRPTKDLNQVVAHVVDAGTSATAPDQVGMRDAGLFGVPSPESVAFQARRIRRFHAAQDKVTANLAPLRYAYEIRRGTVLTYVQAGPPLPGFFLTADTSAFGTATQVGAFDEPDVNINAGDTVRLLDSAGKVVDEAEVASVADGVMLLLKDPGFSNVTPAPGDSFEVYLKQAPVPHEQTNEQLLEVVTEEVLQETVPNYTTGGGGWAAAYNEMKDTLVPDFLALGVQVGDYVLIDPAGSLAGPTGPAVPPEEGARPIGDQSVPVRGPGSPFIAGAPSELDDNRGFYVVTEVYTDRLIVTGASDFSGEVDADVVYGDSGQEYAVLPTISNSSNPNPGSSANTEGQQDLRPTAPAGASSPDPNSYKGNPFSVQPFGYRVIRPSTLFSRETVGLVFFMRERMLSWMEELGSGSQGGKSGSYFIFQRDEHISDVGSPTDPSAGLGLISNLFSESLTGLVSVSPFTNVSDCLSVLDRRYWILDYRLDYLTPIGSATPYSSLAEDAPGAPPLVAGSGRPVLPDRIEDVLNLGDRLRQMRYAWIKFRADRVNGTLPSIIRFDTEFPRRLAEQEEALRLQEGLDET